MELDLSMGTGNCKEGEMELDLSINSRLKYLATGPFEKILNLAAGNVCIPDVDNHEHPSRDDSRFNPKFDLSDTRWPIDDGVYDVVFAFHLIEHIPVESAIHFLGECHRIIRSHGVLVLETPEAGKTFKEYIDGNVGIITCAFGADDRLGNQHRFLYERAGLTTLLLATGWKRIFSKDAESYHQTQVPCFRVEAVKW
jgi:SAM-dependent methyltransferase